MEGIRPFDSLPDELLGRTLALVRLDEARCTRLRRMVALCMRWLAAGQGGRQGGTTHPQMCSCE